MRFWCWINLLFLVGGVPVWSACSDQEATPVESSPAARAQPATPPATADDVSQDVESSEERLLNYEESNGRVLFLHYCAVCHGKTGEGDGLNAYNLRPAVPRNFTETEAMSRRSDAQLAEVIIKGGGETGQSVLMPAWGATLTERQIRYLISYLRLLAASTADETANH